MSIKDIVEGIGNAFSVVWGGIKDLFYQIYTSEWGIIAITEAQHFTNQVLATLSQFWADKQALHKWQTTGQRH